MSRNTAPPILRRIPDGFELLHTLRGHEAIIKEIAWSPDGRTLASGSNDGTIRLWNVQSGKLFRILEGHSAGGIIVSWSPDGWTLASGSHDRTVCLWDALIGQQRQAVEGHKQRILSLIWSPDGQRLASAADDGTIHIWASPSLERERKLEGHYGRSYSLAWSPDGRMLAAGSSDSTIRLWDAHSGELSRTLEGHKKDVNTLAWSPGHRILASGSDDTTIHIWDAQTGRLVNVLEGHTGWVICLRFSSDGKLLASKSGDDTVRLWRCDTWEPLAILDEATISSYLGGLAFHPTDPLLATRDDQDHIIRIWHLDYNVLFGLEPTHTVQYTSAKIVLVGESNVGKSCLAMRLAEDRYPEDHEHGTTHGMRFWPMEPEHLHPNAAAPKGQRRDVILWDMGGQDEYRLIHQLFLHDTTLALILLDPTRGRIAFEAVEAWNKRLEKQLHGRKSVKLLVGAKLDTPSTLIDRQRLKQIISTCQFAGYYETSARTGQGILELREAMAAALDWDQLATTSRPELFQHIRDEIDASRKRGRVVLHVSDLDKRIRKQAPELYERKAFSAVAEQLAAQGVVAVTQLTSGEQVLVLQIGEIERYAGSLIVAARENLRGVPALEERNIASPDIPLPGIATEERLPRLQERVVLECVVQLLIEHGICFRHEGLLIFPSLFRPTELGDRDAISHSVSLYYDFSGAIDNIYASLVAQLVIGEEFGSVRLWEDRAEFESPDQGICGLRKVDRGRGLAHVDVYFEDETPPKARGRFISFVEDHLRRHGVEIIEHVEIICACGYRFSEETIRMRIAKGESDIGCPECDRRTKISEGAKRIRERDPELAQRTWALRTEIEKRKKRIAETVRQVFATQDKEQIADEPLQVLHLGDLHFAPHTDPQAVLQPLVADLHDRAGGLGFEQLDYLVISGDVTNRATPEEFEVARQFVSGLIAEFELTAERCIIVPGNHDLSWDEKVYHWEQERRVRTQALKEGHYHKEGNLYLIRNEKLYPYRFKNFSQHFYHPLVQKEYPLNFENQCIPYFFPKTGLQFITLNSAWEIDEWFRERSSIHSGALARGLTKAKAELGQAWRTGQLGWTTSILRIGVWHHPVTGNDKIRNDAFMGRLKQAGVRLCLHGHIHEERADLFGYLHRQRLHVVGTGSFGSPATARPESTPRLYNLLEIARDHSTVKVHTRWMRKEGGSWEGWAIWPGDDPGQRRTYYVIDL